LFLMAWPWITHANISKTSWTASERGSSAASEMQADYAASEVLADISRAPTGVESQ